MMPVARVPGRVRLGLRRRRLVRADTPLRHAGRPPPLRRRRARPGPRRDPRRRLQPLRAERQLRRRATRSDYFTDRHPNEWGTRHQLRRRAVPTACASSCSPTSSTGSASSTSTACASTPRTRSSTTRPSICWRRWDDGRAQAAAPRSVVIVAENEPQDATADPPGRRAAATAWTALCSEDFHHTARVALTGQREAYYTDYAGTQRGAAGGGALGLAVPGPVLRVAEASDAASRRSTCPPEQFVACLENHDQVANSSTGQRLVELAAPGALRALTALLLLGPGTPMLFQGQEYGSTAAVPVLRRSRRGADRAGADGPAAVPVAVLALCSPTPAARRMHASAATPSRPRKLSRTTRRAAARRWWQLHRDLIAPAPRRSRCSPARRGRPRARRSTDRVAAAARSSRRSGDDRLLVREPRRRPRSRAGAAPLRRPRRRARRWRSLWSSEALEYGGSGTLAWEPTLDRARACRRWCWRRAERRRDAPSCPQRRPTTPASSINDDHDPPRAGCRDARSARRH